MHDWPIARLSVIYTKPFLSFCGKLKFRFKTLDFYVVNYCLCMHVMSFIPDRLIGCPRQVVPVIKDLGAFSGSLGEKFSSAFYYRWRWLSIFFRPV